jgi:hypothetical protein
MSIKIAQIHIVLDEVRKDQGVEAVAAVLKEVDAIDADSIDPADYPQVMRLCGHAELAGGTMTCRNDDDEAPRHRRRAARAEVKKSDGRKPLAMETVINSQKDIRAGFNLAATAIHARAPK